MTKVIFGNHSSVLVPRQDRDSIRKFYCEVLGGEITKADPERDCLRLVGIDEDLSFYEGAGAGPDVAEVKEALKTEAATQ